MSELKAYTFSAMERTGLADYYLKSEADKVIAELEDSHKMEVGQLLIEIAELKDKLRHYPMMAALIENDNKEINKLKDLNHALMLDALRDRDRIRHDKYKRCLAMARWCFTKSNYHFVLARHGEDAKENNRKSILYSKWCKRWLAIADKYKEGNV